MVRIFSTPGCKWVEWVISPGLVVPGLFLIPRRFIYEGEEGEKEGVKFVKLKSLPERRALTERRGCLLTVTPQW